MSVKKSKILLCCFWNLDIWLVLENLEYILFHNPILINSLEHLFITSQIIENGVKILDFCYLENNSGTRKSLSKVLIKEHRRCWWLCSLSAEKTNLDGLVGSLAHHFRKLIRQSAQKVSVNSLRRRLVSVHELHCLPFLTRPLY